MDKWNAQTIEFWKDMSIALWVSSAIFDTRFETKMMVKIYAIEIIFKPHEPFQSYQLTGPANSAW